MTLTNSATGAKVATTANAQGAFAFNLRGLSTGQTDYVIDASFPGYGDAPWAISVVVTISPARLAAAYKRSAKLIPYNQLIKDPAALAGTVVAYSAEVFQYDTNTGTSNFIASVTNNGYGFWSNNIWADVDPAIAAHVCADTIIRFWGEVVGPYTYTTTQNGSLTIPEINIKYLTVSSKAC